MKKIISLLLIFVFSISLSVPAFAAVNVRHFGENTNPSEYIVNFCGNLDGKYSNRLVTTFVIDSSAEFDEAAPFEALKTDSNILYMGYAQVSFDGEFSNSFKFDAPSEVYPVVMVCDDDVSVTYYNHKNWNDIKGFLDDIKNKSMSAAALFARTEEYSSAMGYDVSFVEPEFIDTFAKRILAEKDNFSMDIEGCNLMKTIISDVKTEYDLLKKIKDTDYKGDVALILNDIAEFKDITFDYAGASKTSVGAKLMGNMYYSIEALCDAFEDAVEAVNDGGKNNGGSKGGSSIGGGSFNAPQYMDVPAVTPTQDDAFSDIANVQWARNAINYLYAKDIINGKTVDKFCPDDLITREELVKIVVTAFGAYDENAQCDFADVDKNAWYYSYIASAKSAEIVNGMGSNSFGTGQNITREDMSVIIYNAAVKAGYAFGKTYSDFADGDKISSYATEAVSRLAGEGIINGIGDNSFAPGNTATRAQAAKIIYEILSGMTAK